MFTKWLFTGLTHKRQESRSKESTEGRKVPTQRPERRRTLRVPAKWRNRRPFVLRNTWRFPLQCDKSGKPSSRVFLNFFPCSCKAPQIVAKTSSQLSWHLRQREESKTILRRFAISFLDELRWMFQKSFCAQLQNNLTKLSHLRYPLRIRAICYFHLNVYTVLQLHVISCRYSTAQKFQVSITFESNADF